MATKTTDEIYSEYRAALKGDKPGANVDQTDSDWYTRGRVYSAVLSGVYADNEKIGQDAFPQNARREALLRHKYAYFKVNTFDPATKAQGGVDVTGDAAATVDAGTQVQHPASGNTYTVDEDVVLNGSGEGTIQVTSDTTGAKTNLLPGTAVIIVSPPPGIDAAAVVSAGGINDGTNEEDENRLANRILNRMRSSARGGNERDYIEWALAASASVTSATYLRYPAGAGTTGVIITSGTTDIDAAVDAGDPVTFTPSSDLIAEVQEYIDFLNPGTDCIFVSGPVEVSIDVTVAVRFTTGDKDTLLSGQTLTQGELVEREIKRAIYKSPMGGNKRATDSQGKMTRKSIEDMVDTKLSASDTVVGSLLQIVVNRVVEPLDGVNVDKVIESNKRPVPGTITINNLAA